MLVIRGEPGIGKTSLLDDAACAAEDFLLVRLTGFEQERDVGFAALHRLLAPILHQIERLPEPQRDAMNSALGLAAGPPSTPLLLGLATTALASNAVRARHRMLCIFDDAQWIDRETLAPLTFWARRLGEQGVVVIFAERTDAESTSLLDGFPVLELKGLRTGPARRLLDEVTSMRMDRATADQIVAATGGNPLALVELAKNMTTARTFGLGGSLHPLPVGRRIEELFAGQVRALPVDSRMLLLVAAADSSGDPSVVAAAGRRLGLPWAALEPAKAAGLLDDRDDCSFRHPLIRSAIYGGARAADRRAAHEALAAVTVADGDSERRAWHLAGSTSGVNEAVAVVLESSAQSAAGRGAYTAAVALLCRSAELSPAAGDAALRHLLAGEAALAGGSPSEARALVALARPSLVEPFAHARADRVDGCVALMTGRVRIAAPTLLTAGMTLVHDDVAIGRQTLLEALDAAFMMSATVDDPDTAAIAVAASDGPAGSGSIVDLLLDASAAYVTDGYACAVPAMQSAVAAACRDDVPAESLIRWSFLVTSIAIALWDHEAHTTVMSRVMAAARDRGSTNWLAVGLQSSAFVELLLGRFDVADDLSAQAFGMYADLEPTPGAAEIVGIHGNAFADATNWFAQRPITPSPSPAQLDSVSSPPPPTRVWCSSSSVVGGTAPRSSTPPP